MVDHIHIASVRIAALITALAIVGVMVTMAKSLGSGSQVQAYEDPGMPTLMASLCLAEDVEDALDDVVLNDTAFETPHTKLLVTSRRPWLTPYRADDRPHRPPIC